MNFRRLILLFALCLPASVRASTLDTVGVTLLRLTTTNLDGRGVRVAQTEGGAPGWEVNPNQSGLPTNQYSNHFTWFASGKATTAFPNVLGSDSGHADEVADDFYNPVDGVSINVAHVDNFEASYFSQFIMPSLAAITDSVVNLSFTITGITLTELEGYDSAYDGYAATYNTLIIGASGDGGTVGAPGTAYNAISVGAYGGDTASGPSPDNGRAKPDITAPGDASSFSTPLVSGAAAMLVQAGLRGDGGVDTNSAIDARTIKALLLNGAVKPADWTNISPSPLDSRYGAGVLNVFNSWSQLTAGKHAWIATTSVALGAAHPPDGATGNVNTTNGWDLNAIASTSNSDAINHYYFNLPPTPGGGAHTATATLVWNRHMGQASINNLNLFFYDTGSGSPIAASISSVDNVQHLFIPALPPGRYDLQVLKHGGSMVSSNETYALAFEFFAMPLAVSLAPGTASPAFRWPIYPAAFRLESTTNLASRSSWTPTSSPSTQTNHQNILIVTPPPTGSPQYYRLVRP